MNISYLHKKNPKFKKQIKNINKSCHNKKIKIVKKELRLQMTILKLKMMDMNLLWNSFKPCTR